MKRIIQSHLALSSELKLNMPILELIELNASNKVHIKNNQNLPLDLTCANLMLYAARPDKSLSGFFFAGMRSRELNVHLKP